MQLEISPVLHTYAEAPAATQSSVDSPKQIRSSPVIKQRGSGLMETRMLHMLTHPTVSVMVTEYNPAALTVIQFEISPLLHKYEMAPAGTQRSVDSPVQSTFSPEISQTGSALIVTIWLHTLVHPLTSVIVTEYVASVLTEIQFETSPVLQRYEAAPAATQSSVDSPRQRTLSPVMRQTGNGLTVTS
jgi:hypothetical protein